VKFQSFIKKRQKTGFSTREKENVLCATGSLSFKHLKTNLT